MTTNFAKLKEVLTDAESCPRLTRWEENFLDDLRDRATAYGERLVLSDRQQEVLDQIEAKLYAI